jgi:hypothetical protein
MSSHYRVSQADLLALQQCIPIVTRNMKDINQADLDFVHNALACILYDADSEFEASDAFDDDMFVSAAQQRAYRG